MKTILITALMGLSLLIFAQNKDLENAFSESYAFESVYKYQKAIDALKPLYDENSYPINLRLGWLYYKSGNYTESEKMYARAVELMPYSIEAKMGYTYPLSAKGDANKLISVYEDILKINDKDTKANYYLGMIYYNRKEYAKAFPYVEKVVNMYPFDYESTILLAWINLKMTKTREAKVLFQKALLMSPGDSSATEGLKQVQ